MRPIILFVVAGWSVLVGAGWLGTQALAAEGPKDYTRVAIAISGGPVAYTDQSRQDPPAIVIEFRSRNVRAQFEPLVAVNAGIIKEIRSDYYPPGLSAVPGTTQAGLPAAPVGVAQAGRRALKSLTLTLAQPAAYSITQQANQIVIDIETPPGLLPGRMAIGGLTILGMEARETLISRLKVMEGALQKAAPPRVSTAPKPKPVVVTKPVEIPQPVIQPAPPMPVSRGGLGGFWPGLLLGIGGAVVAIAGWSHHLSSARRAGIPSIPVTPYSGGGILAAFGSLRQVVGWRRRRKPVTVPAGPAELPSAAQADSVFEQLVLKTLQRQDQKVVGSKTIAGLGMLWIIQKDEQRQGVVCLPDGGFFERKILEQFCEGLKLEELRSGTVYALGAFTAPAQTFAKERELVLMAREEVLKMISAELQRPVVEPDMAALLQKRTELEGELAQVQERIKHLEQELAAQKKQWEESQGYLGEERTKKQALEQQVAELTQELAQKVELTAKLSQAFDQLKAKSAEVDQRLAAEQEKRAQLEAQIAQLGEQLKVQATTVAEKTQVIQESTETAKETIKAVAAEEPKATQEVLQGQEHRKWPRFDLSRHKGKGVLVRATSNDGEPMNGDARNISAGGLCVELPSGERLADEFELKLFLPDRAKPIEAIGKLVWKGRGSRRLPAPRSSRQAGGMGQLGVAFSAVNAPDQEAIGQFVEERTPHQFVGAS